MGYLTDEERQWRDAANLPNVFDMSRDQARIVLLTQRLEMVRRERERAEQDAAGWRTTAKEYEGRVEELATQLAAVKVREAEKKIVKAIEYERDCPARAWNFGEEPGHDDFSRGLFEGIKTGLMTATNVIRKLGNG